MKAFNNALGGSYVLIKGDEKESTDLVNFNYSD